MSAPAPLHQTIHLPEPITLRPLAGHDELRACVALQEEAWGRLFSERVPPSILLVAQKMGGISAGAFDVNNRLLGFVFGVTGVRNGILAHWSDMLAVTATWQNRGLGRHLKQYQRTRLLAQGIETMYWTFDPLVAKNAHLNLNKLGAEIEAFFPDFYPPDLNKTDHTGPLDRFLACWSLTQPKAPLSPDLAEATPIVNPCQPDGWPRDSIEPTKHRTASLRIEIPTDIHQLYAEHRACAQAWHTNVRTALQTYLAAGYRVIGFHAITDAKRGFYVLHQPD